MSLSKDLERFSEDWLANPAAKLAFAKLVERAMYNAAKDFQGVRAWIAEEKRTAKALGVE